MILRHVLDFALDHITNAVDNDLVDEAIRLVVPQLLSLTDIDRFDAVARGQVQATIDDALREAGLI